MSSLLHIASRVEAAVSSYVSVRDFADTDTDEWRRRLDQEKVKATHAFRLAKKANGGIAPALHPTLAALYIISDLKGNLSEIGRNHPDLRQHKYYKRNAKFPSDISDLLPPREARWWEDLAAQSSRVAKPLLIRIPPGAKKGPSQENVHGVDMDLDDSDVDQLAEDDEVAVSKGRQTRNRGKKVAEEMPSRKRKGASPQPRKTTKRRAGPSRKNPESGKEPEAGDEAGNYEFECDRCLRAGVTCQPDPMRPCKRCHYNKQGCSLMPVNKKTGKTDRRLLTAAEIFRFRVSQLERKKQQTPGHKKPEKSSSKTSPSTMLSALALESGSSHSPPAASDSPAAATASDSPAPPAPAAEGFPAPTQVAAPRSANFYIQVPTRARHADPQAPSAVAATAPTTTTTIAATLPDATDSPATTVPTFSAISEAAVSSSTPTITITDTAHAAGSAPTITDTVPAAGSTPAITITDTVHAASSTPTIAVTDTVPAAASTISANATPPPSAPSSVGQLLGHAASSSSPVLAPALRRHLKTLKMLPSPTHLQRPDADNSQQPAPGSLMERVLLLERRMDAFEDWIDKDEKWKKELDRKLQRVVSMILPSP